MDLGHTLLLGVLPVVAFMVGLLHRQFADLVSAMAERIRFGKQDPRPLERATELELQQELRRRRDDSAAAS